MGNNTERFGLVLPADDKAALERLAAEEQTSGAAVLRDLVRRETDRRAASELTVGELTMAAKMGLTPSEYLGGKPKPEPRQEPGPDGLTDSQREIAVGTGLGVEKMVAFLAEKRGEAAPEPEPAPATPAAPEVKAEVDAAVARAKASALEADRAARAADNNAEIVRLLKAAQSGDGGDD